MAAVGGVGAIVAQAPVGALVDRTTAKRALIIAGALTVTAGSLAMPLFPGFYSIAVLQALTGIAGSVFAPALAAISLGIVGHRLFSRRIGRNESFNHAGNAFGRRDHRRLGLLLRTGGGVLGARRHGGQQRGRHAADSARRDRP
jgi:MFS family permease